MSNHLHALLGVDDAAQLSVFMQHALANIAKEVGRQHKWSGPFWSRRYRSIVVADADSQIRRLRYILCQGLKEGLVERADHWPGVSSLMTSTHGARMRGTWYDRTAQFEARRRGEKADPARTERTYEIVVSSLPALADRTPEQHRQLVRELVRDEERSVAAERSHLGKTAVLGVRCILSQDPHQAPARSERTPAPLVHAASRAIAAAFRQAYAAFVDAFRAAASSLKDGRPADFPPGAFPPSAPFVQTRAAA
jgi:hypothetical protein